MSDSGSRSANALFQNNYSQNSGARNWTVAVMSGVKSCNYIDDVAGTTSTSNRFSMDDMNSILQLYIAHSHKFTRQHLTEDECRQLLVDLGLSLELLNDEMIFLTTSHRFINSRTLKSWFQSRGAQYLFPFDSDVSISDFFHLTFPVIILLVGSMYYVRNLQLIVYD